MNYASKLLKNKCELFLAIIFIIIIVGDKSVHLKTFMEIPQIRVYVFILSVLIFIFCNKLLGILGIFLVYELFTITEPVMNPQIIAPFITKESVEEEIIYKMSSSINVADYNNDCSYRPFDNSGVSTFL